MADRGDLEAWLCTSLAFSGLLFLLLPGILVRVFWGHKAYGMSLYIKRIYFNYLQPVFQLTQQRAAVNGKSKTLVAQLQEAGYSSWSSIGVLADVLARKSKED